nr:hypothetical protein GCM10020092_101230 [Actinoplanes digitatis]
MYGAAPPVAARVSGAMASPAVAFWVPGSVTATAAVPPPEFRGVGVAAAKSALLLSVSAPVAARW